MRKPLRLTGRGQARPVRLGATTRPPDAHFVAIVRIAIVQSWQRHYNSLCNTLTKGGRVFCNRATRKAGAVRPCHATTYGKSKRRQNVMSQASPTSSAPVGSPAFDAAWSAIRRQFTREVVSRRAAFLCGVFAIGIGFSNAFSVSITEILLGIVAGCWLLAGGFRAQAYALLRNPVALAVLAILALLSLSVLYGAAPLSESLPILRKYRTLAYLVLFILVFRTAKRREAGILAFEAAMVITLAGSILTAIGIPPLENRHTINPANATVFCNHIVHGICMGLFAYLIAHRFVDQPRWRWLTGPLTLLATWNTFFMVAGRTGYLTLAVLIPLFCLQRLRFRELAYVAAVVGGIAVAGFYYSDVFSERIGFAVGDVNAYMDYQLADGPLKPEGWRRPVTRTSCGVRLEWYRAGMQLLARHPVLGVGVGSVKHHLERETEFISTYNLHSEYVMVAAQNGLLGLALFAVLFVAYWRTSRRLSSPMRHLAEGMLVLMLVAGTVNTLITERTEGVLFALFSGLVFAELTERAICKHEAIGADTAAVAEEDLQTPLSKAA